ncbi:MAG: hypothetical protein ACRDZT_09205, partial [Acidimicrobiales bacterium]
MNAILGQVGVAIGLISAIAGVIGLSIGLRSGRRTLLTSAPRAALGVAAGAVLATIAMEHALLTHDFS